MTSTRTINALCFSAMITALLGLLPTPIKAQVFCNPEYMPPGSCVPYDHMLERQKQREQMAYEQRTRIWSPQQWNDFVKAAQESAQRNAQDAERQRMQDPAYKKLRSGIWDFYQSKPSETSKSCQAAFMSVRGGAVLMDFDGAVKGTYIGYFGAGILRPTEARKVTVSLTQSNDTQTVQALHLYLPWDGKFGMILFAVPSTNALIDSIEENQDYTVAMNGQTLVSGKWHGGFTARDWLKKCSRAR